MRVAFLAVLFVAGGAFAQQSMNSISTVDRTNPTIIDMGSGDCCCFKNYEDENGAGIGSTWDCNFPLEPLNECSEMNGTHYSDWIHLDGVVEPWFGGEMDGCIPNNNQ